jgi:peptidoglycan/xylan/chitin deacetylase (PgdA/CDA1 family)
MRHTNDAGTIALTFDDGPNPAATPRILDLLDKHDAVATFFQIGQRVRQFPAICKDILRRGHALGNHTDSHPRLVFLSSETIVQELERCAAAFESATGAGTHWMRPPYGYRGPQLERALRKRKWQIQVVMWSLSGWDWKPQPSERLINRLRRVKGGDIVLLHDGDHRRVDGDRGHTIGALEYWLPRWKEAGLRLTSLDQLAGNNN